MYSYFTKSLKSICKVSNKDKIVKSVGAISALSILHRHDFDKWTMKSVKKGLTQSECQSLPASYGIKSCGGVGNDYWAAAVKECGGIDKLPSEEELLALANMLYDSCNRTTVRADCTGFHADRIPSALSGLGSTWSVLWSNEVPSRANYYAYSRGFSSRISSRNDFGHNRSNANVRVVCAGDL